ncbi:hypothetical protein BDAP_002265 [Binucleata daphniae]
MNNYTEIKYRKSAAKKSKLNLGNKLEPADELESVDESVLKSVDELELMDEVELLDEQVLEQILKQINEHMQENKVENEQNVVQETEMEITIYDNFNLFIPSILSLVLTVINLCFYHYYLNFAGIEVLSTLLIFFYVYVFAFTVYFRKRLILEIYDKAKHACLVYYKPYYICNMSLQAVCLVCGIMYAVYVFYFTKQVN